MPKEETSGKLALNRKAFRDFNIQERFEAGIELRGTEVKAARTGQIGFAGAYARIDAGELILQGLNITPYEFGNIFNHAPDRPRRMLMHKGEILRLKSRLEQRGFTIIPLSVYLKKGKVKVELALCKGKTHGDKRETIKRKTADREAARAIARTGRR